MDNLILPISEGAIEVTVLRHADEYDGYGLADSYLPTTTIDYNKSVAAAAAASSHMAAMMSDAKAIAGVFVYALPVIITLGTIGNALSFLVLVRCHMRSTSVYTYLMALAIADTCVLYVSAFKTWIKLISGFELLHTSALSCRLINFFFLLSLHLSAWLIVLVTVDRFMVVWFPFKASSLCTVTRARLATVALVMISVAYNCHVFWTFELSTDPRMRRAYCGPIKAYSFMAKPFEYLKLTTYSLVPFLVIVVLNFAIITRLQWRPLLLQSRSGSASAFSTNQSSSAAAGAACGKQAKVTYMLVVVSIAWLLLTLPKSIHTMVFELDDSRSSWNATVFRGVSFLLMYTNHAINFYLYCITGRKFRRQLEELSKAVCARSRRRRSRRRRKRSGGSTVCSPSRRTHLQKTNVVDFELHDLAVS